MRRLTLLLLLCSGCARSLRTESQLSANSQGFLDSSPQLARVAGRDQLVVTHWSLNPRGTSWRAEASRRAMLTYADVIEGDMQHDGHRLAELLRAWVTAEEARIGR